MAIRNQFVVDVEVDAGAGAGALAGAAVVVAVVVVAAVALEDADELSGPERRDGDEAGSPEQGNSKRDAQDSSHGSSLIKSRQLRLPSSALASAGSSRLTLRNAIRPSSADRERACTGARSAWNASAGEVGFCLSSAFATRRFVSVRWAQLWRIAAACFPLFASGAPARTGPV